MILTKIRPDLPDTWYHGLDTTSMSLAELQSYLTDPGCVTLSDQRFMSGDLYSTAIANQEAVTQEIARRQ